MNRMKTLAAALALGAFALIPASRAHAQTSLFNEHVDIGAAYDPVTGWDLHIHDETNLAEYAPGDALLHVLPAAAAARPAGSAFDFIGVGAGQTYYRLPDTQNPALIFLGLGAEEADPNHFASWDTLDTRVASAFGTQTGKYVKFSVLNVTHTNFDATPGSGVFSAWINDGSGPINFISSADGVSAADSAYVLAEGHQHYNWGFSAPGTYEVTFQVSSQFSAGGSSNANDTATYTYVVAAPEPGSFVFALLGLPALGLIARRRKKVA